MIKYLLIILILAGSSNLIGQGEGSEPERNNIKPVNTNYYQLPYVVDDGIILTDEKYGKLYMYVRGSKSPRILLEVSADYQNLNVSYNKKRIGLLLNDGYDMKIPAIYLVEENKLEKIGKASNGVSEISFAKDNITCLSIDSTVYVKNGDELHKHIMDIEIEKIRISPDGEHIAIASRKGIIYIMEIETAKFDTIQHAGFASNPVWSPDGNKLVYSSGLDIFVWDKRCNEKYFISSGGAANWSINSEYIIYQKNNPIKMKFVNADIFISKFNGTEHYQLTNTTDKYEMQPVFGLDNDIYFMTYENRQLIHAKLEEGKFEIADQKVLLEVK